MVIFAIATARNASQSRLSVFLSNPTNCQTSKITAYIKFLRLLLKQNQKKNKTSKVFYITYALTHSQFFFIHTGDRIRCVCVVREYMSTSIFIHHHYYLLTR
jgi:hypothetical protein